MTVETLTVSQVLTRVDQALTSTFPAPIWVRGEVSGLRRTSGGAVFFRLADAELDEAALEVSARGRIMFDIERLLDHAGIGTLRDGVELRARGTVGIDRRSSRVRLTLLEIDPAFTAGRLAMLKAEVLRRMAADGSLGANALLPIPLVPQRIGLVTSRGSAAHADFVRHLERSGFRFRVSTAHTSVQGEGAPDAVARAIDRVGSEAIDVIVLIRGGGSKLDLAVFDSEVVGRAIASAPVPVVTGIGHEIDRTVADEAAAVSLKTPTAAAEWLVAATQDFAGRVEAARVHIEMQARACLERAGNELTGVASALRGARGLLAQQRVLVDHLGEGIAQTARAAIGTERRRLEGLGEWFSTVGVDQTLSRGFALLLSEDGSRVIRSIRDLRHGDRARIRLSDGTVRVIVEET